MTTWTVVAMRMWSPFQKGDHIHESIFLLEWWWQCFRFCKGFGKDFGVFFCSWLVFFQYFFGEFWPLTQFFYGSVFYLNKAGCWLCFWHVFGLRRLFLWIFGEVLNVTCWLLFAFFLTFIVINWKGGGHTGGLELAAYYHYTDQGGLPQIRGSLVFWITVMLHSCFFTVDKKYAVL